MVNLTSFGQVHSGVLSIEMLSNDTKRIKLALFKGTSFKPVDIGDIEPNKSWEVIVVCHHSSVIIYVFTILIPLVDQ